MSTKLCHILLLSLICEGGERCQPGLNKVCPCIIVGFSSSREMCSSLHVDGREGAGEKGCRCCHDPSKMGNETVVEIDMLNGGLRRVDDNNSFRSCWTTVLSDAVCTVSTSLFVTKNAMNMNLYTYSTSCVTC